MYFGPRSTPQISIAIHKGGSFCQVSAIPSVTVRKRELVDKVCSEWDVSIRRGCRVLSVDTSTYHYKSRRRGQADLEQRVKEIAETRMRYGYRRVHVVLQREGWMTNIKRTYRLYNAQGLQLRNKTPIRRVKAKLWEDRCPASQPNQTWAMDFVHDQLAMGKKIRVLTVVDIFSKFSPVVDPRFSYRAEDVVMTLERVCGHLGYAKGVTLDFSRPGKPTDNAFIEAFNSKFRSECLNAHWFMSLDDARSKMEDWRRYYNEERPHSGIGQKVPILLHNSGGASSPSLAKEAENSSLS
jgi:putative transposase